jgi:2-polyprenyl-3-methyl-5-hydroxy-6-metoxy-1,4-benzoquinol methylase
LSVLPFTCTDYTVSKEVFSIAHCGHCEHRFTVNPPAENVIGKYYQSEDYVSHSNTQKGLINRLYHIVRLRALKKKREILVADTGKVQGQLLDIGCGIGAFLGTMKAANWEVKGLEPDAGARAQVQNIHGIVAESPEQLFSLAPESYDAVTMWHVLEHVHRLDEYLTQIHTILKKDGVFFVAVPNYSSLDADIYQEKWAAYDVPRHLHHFCPTSMHNLLKQHGFEIDKLRPMPFDSFYVSLLSEKYVHGKIRFISGFWNGWKSFLKARKEVKYCSSLLYVIRKK